MAAGLGPLLLCILLPILRLVDTVRFTFQRGGALKDLTTDDLWRGFVTKVEELISDLTFIPPSAL